MQASDLYRRLTPRGRRPTQPQRMRRCCCSAGSAAGSAVRRGSEARRSEARHITVTVSSMIVAWHVLRGPYNISCPASGENPVRSRAFTSLSQPMTIGVAPPAWRCQRRDDAVTRDTCAAGRHPRPNVLLTFGVSVGDVPAGSLAVWTGPGASSLRAPLSAEKRSSGSAWSLGTTRHLMVMARGEV